jgi:type IV secretion system T-DNA border endonuclease VirD1
LTNITTKKKTRDDGTKRDWKGKAPNRGQWKPASGEKVHEKIGFAVVSVKVRPAEKEELKALCKQLGVSPNWAMRSMARHAAGFLEVHKNTLNELQLITRQISGVANNINQIAKAGNRTLDPDYRAFMEDRKELGKELIRLEHMMQTILNVGRRRADGLARLKEVNDIS